MNKKTITIELTKKELIHLINDTIHYIYDIKSKVFGNDWNFGTNITEVNELTEEQLEKLISYGYYSRKELLNKLQSLVKENFQELCCNGVTNNE